MKEILLILLAVITYAQIEAQTFKKKSIDISLGYGLSSPYEDIDIVDSGFYAQGEYIFEYSKWLDLRPYAGIVITNSNGKDLDDNPTDFKATTKAFLIGGKARVTVPIPWIAPFIETGIGASIGAFETVTPLNNIDKKGLVVHIPLSLGFELGPKHNIELALSYYFQPSVEQYAGAFAFGVSIPLKK